jgi:hypothetical protein
MKKILLNTVTTSLLLAGCVAMAGPEWRDKLSDAGLELHGFIDYGYGLRTQNDPFEDDKSLDEIRLQLDSIWYHDLFTAQLKADLLYDNLAENHNDVDLDMGRGFFDLRQANVMFSPLGWMDVKVGRQVLTWGTGDLVFINDMFPKDWQSFFLGRDVEYLKAPSDAVFVSMFPGVVSIDLAYMPCFDADRHITGERISYWNGQSIVGQNSVLDTDRPNGWFDDEEISARIYRNLGAYEVAVYGYDGFWKSPGGMDPTTGKWLFPNLSVYGASTRGPLGSGIANIEAGYYDSADDRDGDDPFINNSESRFLVGYEQEVAKNLTIAVQYYLEHMMDYSTYRQALIDMMAFNDSARDEDRHTLTLRITSLLMNQNLILSCFTRYSPSDKDVYIKPTATYKISDQWQAAIGGDIFFGSDEYSFLGQFENNSNIHASLRCSF